MKRKIYLFFILIITLSFTINAQLRVLQNGRVQIGTLKLENEDAQNVTTMQVFGPNGSMRSGSKLTFGDFGQYSNQGWNVFVGEYGPDDTDQLWLHGKSGIYLTTNGYANNVVAYYNPATNSNFIFNTNLRVNGVNITSDVRLKENVHSLQNSLGILEQVSGVTYNYKLSEIKKYREQNEVTVSTTSKMQNDLLVPSETISIEKANKNREEQNEIDRKEVEDAARKRIGFLAQDIQKVLPELVHTDENGVMSIDYIGFIPIIVESIKEMQETIQEQNEQIKYLQNILSENANILRSVSTSVAGKSLVAEARLYNRENASVSYSLPSTFTAANLHIFDIAGRLIKKIELDSYSNILTIASSEIGYGTFVYALYIDGRKVDTLKKIVTP